MNVGVFSLQYLSFTQVAARRQVAADTPGSVTIVDKAGKNITYEAMETYLKRALDNRLALVYRAMVTAFAKHSPTKFDVSFVTAPELFWNVPWSEFLSEDELQNAADLCLDTVTRNVRTLISKFPADKYGKIVLLPGTVAMLKPNADIRLADGTLATADGKAIVYEALNQVICAHNLPLDDKDYPRPAYMIWPKRTVSTIDYADKYVNTGFAGVGDCKIGEALAVNPANPNVKNKIMNCTATGRSLRVAFVGSSIAQSFDAQGRLLSRTFQNDIVEGLPFGVNICLDYNEASVLKNSFRMAELDERIYKLDFLIAARMALDLKNYANTPYIQYALRNDGFSGGITQAWKLIWTKGSGASLGTMSYNDLAPLDADSPVGKLKGAIAVDESDAFVAPEGMDTAGIPKILDKMNACYVRIWALDVDTSDAVSSALHVSSAQSAVRSEEVQFIE